MLSISESINADIANTALQEEEAGIRGWLRFVHRFVEDEATGDLKHVVMPGQVPYFKPPDLRIQAYKGIFVTRSESNRRAFSFLFKPQVQLYNWSWPVALWPTQSETEREMVSGPCSDAYKN